MTILELRHVYYLHMGRPYTSDKSLGYFTTMERLQGAVTEYRTMPGFRDTPDAFVILRREVFGEVQNGLIYYAGFDAYDRPSDDFDIALDLGLYAEKEPAVESMRMFLRDNPGIAQDPRFEVWPTEEDLEEIHPIELDKPCGWREGFDVHT